MLQTIRIRVSLLASLLLCGLLAKAQAPLTRPLADFEKLASQLKAGSVVGEPIRAGDTTVVPFASVEFAVGAGEAMIGAGGGMGAKTVPLGVLIVEGDEVRAELFPEREERTSVFQQIVQAILDRKVVIMGNGLNAGSSSAGGQELAPIIAAMMGQTTLIGNALNVGHMNAPASAANAPATELTKLIDARRYVDALAAADALLAKDPRNADLHAWRGRIMSSLSHGNPADMAKYGAGAREEFEKALSLDPANRNALLGRGIGRLMAPPACGGDLDGAIADFEKAVAGKPSPEAYYYLGEAFKGKGLKDKAAAAFKKALELRPDDPDVLKALAAVK